MTPTTYGRDFAYCLKSHGGVRGFNASLWRFLLRCTLFCHSVATFLTSVSSYEGGCGFEGNMERSNLFNHLLRIFDEGLSMKTTELEYGTLEVTVENRSQDKKITFLAKGMEDAKQKAAEWQVGQMLLNCDDFEEIVMFLAQRKKLKKEMANG